jgi:glucose/mannose-6-phosphate isomerase
MNDQTLILNSKQQISQLDKSNVLGSIEALADQVKHAWQETQQLTFKPTAEIKNVVIAAMGGSGLGPDVVKHLFKDQIKVPFEIYNSYHLPAYVNQHTLVILSSYSGTTEEVLSCAQQALQAQAQIMIITSGGKLKALAKERQYPAYIINPKYNPSNQPRMAIGYSIMGGISLLSAAGIISFKEEQMKAVIAAILHTEELCRVDVEPEKNKAKLLALELIDRRPVFVSSEFLVGAMHTATNQFNENAKIFADYKIIPEINHHLLEGLTFPKSNRSSHLFVFVNSDLLTIKNQQRMKLTQQVAQQKQLDTLEVKLTLSTKLTQVFELITIFAHASFYLAMLEGIDPAPIKTVDWFKAQLKKQPK